MEDLQVDSRVQIPAAEMRLAYSRSGGPGGQHVNTTDTRVQLTFDLAGTTSLHVGVKRRLREAFASRLTKDGQLIITSDRYRSRLRNVEDARERLASMIRAHLVPPKKRKPTKPSRASQRRRVDAKKRRSGVKKGRGRVRQDD